jgi:NAD(P)-dependent dehydrogenase (short-subunit alcohol dehydrogenase family)
MGVRVNTVHPGYMPPMLNATNAGERDAKIEMTPLRRIGKPIEVAYGVLFLASDEASFVTGAELAAVYEARKMRKAAGYRELLSCGKSRPKKLFCFP